MSTREPLATPSPDLARRRLLARTAAATTLAGLPAWLAGCATLDGGSAGPPVEAPQYRVGDRWVYRGEDGFRARTRWEETHTVTAAGPEGIAIEIEYRGDIVSGTRVERLVAPGLVSVGALLDIETRRFAEPLQRYNFPLTRGKNWNQWVDQIDESPAAASGQINYFARVGGWSSVATPAGTFDAVDLRVLMQLADETFWRFRTMCNHLLHYAPAVRGLVRADKRADYREKGGPSGGINRIPVQFTQLELASFSPGP